MTTQNQIISDLTYSHLGKSNIRTPVIHIAREIGSVYHKHIYVYPREQRILKKSQYSRYFFYKSILKCIPLHAPFLGDIIIVLWTKNYTYAAIQTDGRKLEFTDHRESNIDIVLPSKKKNIHSIHFPSNCCCQFYNWVHRSANSYNNEVKRKIIEFSNNKSMTDLILRKMDLNSADLQIILNVLDIKEVSTRLEYLDLSENRLTNIPESLFQMCALYYLNLSSNKLSKIPMELGQLSLIKELNLSDNQIRDFPMAIGKMQKLCYLRLSKNFLRILPEENFYLPQLEEIYLDNNQLTVWPLSFGYMDKLRILSLAGNNFHRLMEELSWLESLEKIDLRRNKLISVSESFSSMKKLRMLLLNENSSFLGIPLKLLQLNRECEINLSDCNLPHSVQNNLFEITKARHYIGPSVLFSPRPPSFDFQENSLEGSLLRLYKVINKPFKNLFQTTLESWQKKSLLAWASKLFSLNEVDHSQEFQHWVIKNFLYYMEIADNDSEFRHYCFKIIRNTSALNRNRLGQSLIHLDIAQKLTKLDLRNTSQLANFLLRGILAIKILEELAEEKAAADHHEPVDTFFAYPILLKERLQLPIDIEGLDLLKDITLSSKDVQNAEIAVLKHLANQDGIYQFLIQQDKWIEALVLKYPKEYHNLLSIKEKKASKATTGTDFLEIKEEHDQGLVLLTKNALQLDPW